MTDIFLSKLEALKKRQATIIDAVTKIAARLSDPEKANEAARLAEELPGIFETQNRSILDRNHFNAMKLARNNANRAFLEEKAKAMEAALQKLVAGLAEAKEKIPEPKGVAVPMPVPRPPKPKSLPPTLLSPQELRDQIARKIERPPTAPQTTGNIWENWSKNQQPPAPPAEEENQP